MSIDELQTLVNGYAREAETEKKLKAQLKELEESRKAKLDRIHDLMFENGLDHQKLPDGKVFRVSAVYRGGFLPETFDAFVQECAARKIDCPAKAKAVYLHLPTPEVTMDLFQEVHAEASSIGIDCPQQTFDKFLRNHPFALPYTNWNLSHKGSITVK